MKKIIISSIVMAVIFTTACAKKTAVAASDCTGVTPTYTTDIKPIIDANCLSCHNSGNKSGGYDLSNYNNCKSAKDKIVGSVQHASGFAAMPDGSAKLSDATIKIINCWSQNNAPQ
jgi:hypothetical protein